MLQKIIALMCSGLIVTWSSFAAAQDFRFGQPFEGVTVKAGFTMKFGEPKVEERGPQFRFAVEAGSEHVVGALGDERVYRSAPLTGLQWDMDQRFSFNMGGLKTYQYDYGESQVLPTLYADGFKDDVGWRCHLVCVVAIVVVAAGIGVGIYYAVDDDDDGIRRRTSGNDRDEVIININ